MRVAIIIDKQNRHWIEQSRRIELTAATHSNTHPSGVFLSCPFLLTRCFLVYVNFTYILSSFLSLFHSCDPNTLDKQPLPSSSEWNAENKHDEQAGSEEGEAHKQ